MKKTFYNILLSAAAVLSLVSCGEKEESRTWITAYPSLTMNGDNVLFVEKGDDFVDPGCVAILDGEDVSDKVVVISNVDASKPGKYSISYSLTNVDGFAASASRTVYVMDSSDKFTGVFVVQEGTKRTTDAGVSPYSGFEVIIYGSPEEGYVISDLLAGYYEYGRGYGSSYAMAGLVNLGSDGTISLVSSYIPGWGDGCSSLSGTFDGTTISYETVYAGMIFTVILKK